MLQLTRRPGQTIEIGDDIVIHFMTTGHQVRVGIEAPESLKIRRSNNDGPNVGHYHPFNKDKSEVMVG